MKYALAIIVILILATVYYRTQVWNLNQPQRAELVNDCLSYGDKAFCTCFIDNLNKKMPAKTEIDTLLVKHEYIATNPVMLKIAEACY